MQKRNSGSPHWFLSPEDKGKKGERMPKGKSFLYPQHIFRTRIRLSPGNKGLHSNVTKVPRRGLQLLRTISEQLGDSSAASPDKFQSSDKASATAGHFLLSLSTVCRWPLKRDPSLKAPKCMYLLLPRTSLRRASSEWLLLFEAVPDLNASGPFPKYLCGSEGTS